MTKKGTILVVDDNKTILQTLRLLLNGYFERVLTIASPNRIDTVLREEAVDIVLLDMNFSAGINSGNEGIYWLTRIKKINANIPVVVFTAYADIDLAVRAIKEGAADFVAKPWDNKKLIATLLAAYNLHRSKQEVKYLKEMKHELSTETPMFWGTSRAMQQVRTMVDKVADTEANILITGENGTGKEVLAGEIHRLSSRAGELMVSVDMGALTETLFESELFGHVKGAFTDAHFDRIGKFEVAQGGTLFLDEIGNLPYHLQAKLLSAIQRRTIVKVGSNRPIPVDVRLICATNRNLQKMVADKQFREDLFYRINTIHIEIPPLRERPEDIVPLGNLFLERYAAKYHKQGLMFDADVQRRLREYPWYGNIRELQHTVEKAVIVCDTECITAENLSLSPSTVPPMVAPQTVMTLEEMERMAIRNAIRQNGNNMSAVATQLGITRQTLYNKIRKYGL